MVRGVGVGDGGDGSDNVGCGGITTPASGTTAFTAAGTRTSALSLKFSRANSIDSERERDRDRICDSLGRPNLNPRKLDPSLLFLLWLFLFCCGSHRKSAPPRH